MLTSVCFGSSKFTSSSSSWNRKKKGTLDFGADADFVILNDKLEVQSTWIAGECVFTI